MDTFVTEKLFSTYNLSEVLNRHQETIFESFENESFYQLSQYNKLNEVFIRPVILTNRINPQSRYCTSALLHNSKIDVVSAYLHFEDQSNYNLFSCMPTGVENISVPTGRLSSVGIIPKHFHFDISYSDDDLNNIDFLSSKIENSINERIIDIQSFVNAINEDLFLFNRNLFFSLNERMKNRFEKIQKIHSLAKVIHGMASTKPEIKILKEIKESLTLLISEIYPNEEKMFKKVKF